MLKQVVTTLKMTPLTEAVSIPFVTQFVDEDGRVQANEVMETSARAMLDEFYVWNRLSDLSAAKWLARHSVLKASKGDLRPNSVLNPRQRYLASMRQL
jgi:hypothetical protein